MTETKKQAEHRFQTPANREEMVAVSAALARTLLLREEKQKQLARAVDALRAEHMPEIEAMKSDEAELLAALERFALENPEVWGSRKTIDTGHGTLGWRTNPPALKTAPKWTWQKVVNNIVHRFPGWVRHKMELNKEVVLREAGNFSETDLRNMGLKIVREEQFRFDLVREGGAE